ncbi:hypothetical protein B0H67DRAFT_640944 [Lasiosphaeris hirsuta]|uniref:Uncharacterized protein n=1 Tax=Lasiosphaeris hirsuta TaxID=260670 RepID=A0AA40E1F9_9PEZI|nr:hypothetical protein B0H67DRAFT_640944 [Lasiosphaeris hirsuta]
MLQTLAASPYETGNDMYSRVSLVDVFTLLCVTIRKILQDASPENLTIDSLANSLVGHEELAHLELATDIDSEFLFGRDGFVEATQRFRNDSAIEVLLNPTNRKIRLYTLEEESFEDVVIELFESLEKLIGHESQGEAEAKGVNMKPRVRSHLQGGDFRDVAITRDPLYIRATTPPSSRQTRVDFAKSTHAVTLFGHGFGELIKPAETASSVDQDVP